MSETIENTLFFLSTRGGATQIWALDLESDPKEPYPVSNFDGLEPSNLKIGGHVLAFTVNVYPDCPDFSCTKKRDDAVKERGENTWSTYD